MSGWKARPTVYCGIPMRSRLEARYAAFLGDRSGWAYEPRAYADEHGQYLPDFQLLGDDDDPPAFVEVKPTREAALGDIDRVRPIFASEPEAWIDITWPSLTRDGWDAISVHVGGWIDYTGGEGYPRGAYLFEGER